MSAAKIDKTIMLRGSRERLTPRRLVVTLVTLSAFLVILGFLAVSMGSEHVGFSEILRVATGVFSADAPAVTPEHRIILDIRVSRVLMSMVVGAALSVAGAAYQALLRNPLADPYILGVSTGAALGAIAATIFAESIPLSRPLAAFLGAVLTIAIVYILGQTRRGYSSERLILAGVITNTFLSSIVIFLLTTATDMGFRSGFSWLIGNLSGDARLLPLVALFIAIGASIIYVNARSLNLLMMGEQDALALGVEVERVKVMVFVAASLITGAAVSISGVIGFVGLVIPHGVRLAGGSDNRLVVPASALSGAAFLLITDTVARTILAPRELHIGVITALIGAPVFVYLLRRTG